MGYFFYALKAFDVLERLDPSPEYWEGQARRLRRQLSDDPRRQGASRPAP